ncbi:universal stress protein [Comamonas aquatica]|uniref:universal stress protein n=1 Tax=Comamonas aquatica TaxID=225991 RepID=UPI001B35DA0C|nr:universal stress protein [Comamonas aquatica]QTX19744.1 universal stress protein [Comamonas aquatica]
MTQSTSHDHDRIPDRVQRDDLGRLVAVTWLGTAEGQQAGSARWLVAVDGSACALHAVQAAARLVALGQGSGIDLVHVQSWLSKEAAETGLARGGWVATAPARHLLEAASIPWNLHVLMGEAADEIVGLAHRLGSLGIAVGSQGLTAAESVLLGSVADQVLRRAALPVLIVNGAPARPATPGA